MSVNKDAAFRYKIINNCLRNNMRKWTKKDLLDAINYAFEEKFSWNESRKRMEIKERQLNYDIAEMKSLFGAPIEQRRDGKQYYYFYEDPEFSIEQQQVSEDDLRQLRQAVHLLKQIKGFSVSEDIEGVVSRLENKIRIGEEGSNKAIDFENPPSAMGIENLGDIYESIINSKVLKINYRPFKAPSGQEQIIHPYFLKEYNNRWFLFGWNEDRNRIENMPLDRMDTIKVVNRPFKKNENFNPEEYFKNMVGVTRPNDAIPENIEIKIDVERAPYILSKPLHHSQEVTHKYKDGSVKLKWQLIINKELISQLLSFGHQLEVLKPLTLRNTIREMLDKGLSRYNS